MLVLNLVTYPPALVIRVILINISIMFNECGFVSFCINIQMHMLQKVYHRVNISGKSPEFIPPPLIIIAVLSYLPDPSVCTVVCGPNQ